MARATDVIAPSSDQTVIEDVLQYLSKHDLEDTRLFQHYDAALRAVWPQLFVADPAAALFLSINVYLECAELKRFRVIPEYLKRAKEENHLFL